MRLRFTMRQPSLTYIIKRILTRFEVRMRFFFDRTSRGGWIQQNMSGKNGIAYIYGEDNQPHTLQHGLINLDTYLYFEQLHIGSTKIFC